MALQTLRFLLKPMGKYVSVPNEWSHTGVVGSGDMEVLMRHEKLDGAVSVTVRTPVRGFDEIWEKVLARFVKEQSLGDVSIEINDNNATPYIVSMRLKQALSEAMEGSGL